MSLTYKNINLPTGYNYVVTMQSMCELLRDLHAFFAQNHVYNWNNGYYENPPTGLTQYAGIDIFVYNQSKQGIIIFHFKCREDHDKLLNECKKKKGDSLNSIKNQVYRYDARRMGWILDSTYSKKDVALLVGYQTYYDKIVKDIENYIKYNNFLQSIGESKSLNYLLYGPTGVGKTTLIRTIASKFDMNVCVVNGLTTANLTNINLILSPNLSGLISADKLNKRILLLFEDFDRFLQIDNIDNAMSVILNSLDGFDDNGKIVRFFTGNNCEIIFANNALNNRMSAKFEFFMPSRQMYVDKLKQLLSFHETYDEELATKLVDLIVPKNVTLRPFTNHVIRYLFDENYLQQMIDNIGEL
jgi:hypothetical protein